MDKRFKPVLAAAFAAGLIPAMQRTGGEANAATIAGFTFEALPTTGATVTSSYSYAADILGGTVTMSRPGTAGSINSVGGNPGKALTGNNMAGGSYTFGFAIDDMESLAISFDMTGSGTGPRDFQVLYSLDGSTFVSFTSFALSLMTVTATATSNSTVTGTLSGFASASSATAWNWAFSAPAAFSDSITGVAGQSGYLRILQSGTGAINPASTIGSGGTNRIDNVYITASPVAVPEPAAGSIVTLAAAALAARRRTESR